MIKHHGSSEATTEQNLKFSALAVWPWEGGGTFIFCLQVSVNYG